MTQTTIYAFEQYYYAVGTIPYNAPDSMPRQFPNSADHSVDRTDEPSVAYLDDERTHEIVSVLATDSAFEIFRRLTDEPETPSEIAAEMDITVQNVLHHLDKLKATGLVEIVDTCYSDKGREMDVYAAVPEPTVVVLWTQDNNPELRSAFRQIGGAIGAPAVLVLLWQMLSDLIEIIRPD